MEQRVTHMGMESTGVFCKPVYNLLEGLELTLLVVNARHIKVVPGRKTDVKDAFAFRVGLLMVDLSLQQR